MDDHAPHPQRKRIWLKDPAYSIPGTPFLITVCCRDHAPLLRDTEFAELVRASLLDSRFAARCEVYAFAIMPDHVHVLVGITKEDLVRLVAAWKSHTTRLFWGRGNAGALWARSFHDHGLRQVESIRRAAEYIVSNPERAGIGGREGLVWHRWMHTPTP